MSDGLPPPQKYSAHEPKCYYVVTEDKVVSKSIILKSKEITESRKVVSNEEDNIDALDKKLKYLKERKVILNQIQRLDIQIKSLLKILEILKLEFETGK